MYNASILKRPLSLGGHAESQENKRLCLYSASLALNSRLAEACRAKTQLLFTRYSTWPPSDKGLFRQCDDGVFLLVG